MKKILFGILLYIGLVSNALAAPAVAPYYWNVWEVASSNNNYRENVLYKSSTTDDHGGIIQFSVVIKGGWTHSTYVLYNNSVVHPFKEYSYDLDNNDGIIDTWLQIYEVYGDAGTVEVKDQGSNGYLEVKDRLYIR